MSAIGAFLGGVMRVYEDDRYTGEFSFVDDFALQVVEAPGVLSSPLAFSNSYPLADASEVFEGNTGRGAFAFLNEILRDDVVDVVSETRFLSLAFPQQAFSRLCVFGLQSACKFTMSVSQIIDVAAGEAFAVAVGRNIDNAQVDTEIVFRFTFGRLRYVNADVKPELTISVYEVGLTPNTLQVYLPVIVKDERYVDPIFKRLDVDLIGLLELPEPVVIDYRTVFFESVMLLFVALICFFYLADSADGKLRSKTEFRPDVVVAETVQNYLAVSLLLVRHVRDVIAGSVESFHSLQKLLLLLLGCVEFQFHSQYHNANIVGYYQCFCQALNCA
jgi:hypothetical protein